MSCLQTPAFSISLVSQTLQRTHSLKSTRSPRIAPVGHTCSHTLQCPQCSTRRIRLNETSEPIEVTAASATLTVPETVVGATEFEVTWTGPLGHGDYVGIQTDPLDNLSFWITGEYVGTVSPLIDCNWKTRVGKVKYNSSTEE